MDCVAPEEEEEEEEECVWLFIKKKFITMHGNMNVMKRKIIIYGFSKTLK
jgi:hypothetical protein